MAVRSPLRAVDRILATYNLVLMVVWATVWSATPYAPWLCAAHGAAAILPWLIVAGEHQLSRPGWVLREVYPFLLLAVFWSELGLLRGLLHGAPYDPAVEAMDLAVFGVHLHMVWMPRMPEIWLSETMHGAYFAYYFLIALPALWLLARRRRDAYHDLTFRLLLGYLVCYVIYLAFPVDGPIFRLTPFHGPLTAGFFYHLAHGVVEYGHAQGATFPSSHVVGAVTIAWVGWRYFPWPVGVLLGIEALGVTLSTVYTQNHYAVDSIAGVALAVLIQLWVAPALLRMRAPVVRPPLPVLPQVPPLSRLGSA
jgi:membrane-associated phospholipid phosphatase